MIYSYDYDEQRYERAQIAVVGKSDLRHIMIPQISTDP